MSQQAMMETGMNMNWKEFYTLRVSNQWVQSDDGNLAIYLRKGPRYINGRKYTNIIDLSSVSAETLGTGSFGKWWFEFVNRSRDEGFQGIFIENVLNRRFADWFWRYPGTVRVYGGASLDDNNAPCFFLNLEARL